MTCSCPLMPLSALPLSELSIKKGVVAMWEIIADIPLNLSTCATVNGQLLAVGGQEDDTNLPPTRGNRSVIYQMLL